MEERAREDGRLGLVAQAAEEVAEMEPEVAAELTVEEPVVVEVSEVEEVDEAGRGCFDLLPCFYIRDTLSL